MWKHISEFYQLAGAHIEIDGEWFGKPQSKCKLCTLSARRMERLEDIRRDQLIQEGLPYNPPG